MYTVYINGDIFEYMILNEKTSSQKFMNIFHRVGELREERPEGHSGGGGPATGWFDAVKDAQTKRLLGATWRARQPLSSLDSFLSLGYILTNWLRNTTLRLRTLWSVASTRRSDTL